MTFSSKLFGNVSLVLTLFGALAGGLSAGTRSSLSDLDIETAEAKMTLEKVLAENVRLKEEAQRLQEKLTVAEANAARMTESLALATSEAEVFRRQSGELKLRLEALGISGGSGSANKVEQRLLNAVSDLRNAEQERRRLHEALTALSEASIRFSKTSGSADAEARRGLDQQLRKAGEALGTANAAPATPMAATLTDGMIINISEELALFVANIGAKHGVTAGMPFQVLRNNQVIGGVRVVEVREKIAGAVIEYLSSEKEKIRVGDRLKVAARQ